MTHHNTQPAVAELAITLGNATLGALSEAQKVVEALTARQLYIAAVESCTGGAFTNALTSISGSSGVLRESFVTYSNEAKIALGVPESTITTYTVYSTQTAVAMAQAGLRKAVRADIGIGITGSLTRVDPANNNSVPGEVYFAVVWGDHIIERKLQVAEPHRMLAKLVIVSHVLGAVHDMLTQHS